MRWRRSWFSLKGTEGVRESGKGAPCYPGQGPGTTWPDPCNKVSWRGSPPPSARRGRRPVPLSPGRRRALVAGLVLAAIAGIAYVSTRPRPLPPEAGMVRATEVSVAPELSGRMGRIRVHPGDAVRAGDVL